MQRKHNIAIALAMGIVAFIGTSAMADPRSATGEYDPLPKGAPAELAQLFHSALDLPNSRQWPAEDKRQLLQVVTVRYKNRLIDRAQPISRDRTLRYVERLAESPLAQESPGVVRQTCAQYGFTEGACADHAGYVHRALVLEEMLVQRNLSLAQLETELVGEPLPALSAWRGD